MPNMFDMPVELHLQMLSNLQDPTERPLTPRHHSLTHNDLFAIFHTCQYFRNIARPLVLRTVDVATYDDWERLVTLYDIDNSFKSYLK